MIIIWFGAKNQNARQLVGSVWSWSPIGSAAAAAVADPSARFYLNPGSVQNSGTASRSIIIGGGGHV